MEKKIKGPAWPTKRLTLEEQIKIMGRHWRGHPNYVPTKAHLHPASYFMEQVAKKAACQGRYGIY